MKPILVSSGEPAGIGPDICLDLANSTIPVVVMGSDTVFLERARLLNRKLDIIHYHAGDLRDAWRSENTLVMLSSESLEGVCPGQLNDRHAPYVMRMLTQACQEVLAKHFSAWVTGPVHKGVLNQAGFLFSGHTEFIQAQCGVASVVMLLASPRMKVALVTTHLPLAEVPQSITISRVKESLKCLHEGLQMKFGIPKPRIAVAGLNPHAGELGYLGKEEIEVIDPALRALRQSGFEVEGPFPADTLFSQQHLATYDAFLTMYHDQGLPVLKYADFDEAVNVTLGLPIIRTSVDHGTALSLAGTGYASSSSLRAAVQMAWDMAHTTEVHDDSNDCCDG